jgi:hypothetical protein
MGKPYTIITTQKPSAHFSGIFDCNFQPILVPKIWINICNNRNRPASMTAWPGDIVDSGIGLSYRPAGQHCDYIPLLVTKNLASGWKNLKGVWGLGGAASFLAKSHAKCCCKIKITCEYTTILYHRKPFIVFLLSQRYTWRENPSGGWDFPTNKSVPQRMTTARVNYDF